MCVCDDVCCCFELYAASVDCLGEWCLDVWYGVWVGVCGGVWGCVGGGGGGGVGGGGGGGGTWLLQTQRACLKKLGY